MKIGIIAHNAHPVCEPFQGGLEMLTSLLVNELVVRGHEVTTLCVKGSELNGTMQFYYEFDNTNDENCTPVDLQQFGEFYASINDFLRIGFDIIHNNSLSHHGIILGSLCQIPYVTSFHTPIFENIHVAINAIGKNPNQLFTAVSKSLGLLYQEHLAPVHTVYNGIDINSWNTSAITNDYFSWCGRICKEKGLKEIMDLCHAQNLHLKIAGPIANQEYFDTEIKKRLIKYDTCEYLGHLKQREVNHLMSHSRAFLFTSTWEEPYGLVIAEALASGIPVIANDIGAAKEIITKNSGLLFNLENGETFIKALENLANLDVKNCRKRAETFCCHHRMVDDYERLYHSIIVKSKQTAC